MEITFGRCVWTLRMEIAYGRRVWKSFMVAGVEITYALETTYGTRAMLDHFTPNWKVRMEAEYGNQSWKLRMEISYGSYVWKSVMEGGYGNHSWRVSAHLLLVRGGDSVEGPDDQDAGKVPSQLEIGRLQDGRSRYSNHLVQVRVQPY